MHSDPQLTVTPCRARFVPLIVSLAIVGFHTGCSKQAETVTEAAIRPAKLITIEATTNERTVVLPAVIEAAGSVDLNFPVGGLVAELPVSGGQEVAAGTVIARLDPRSFRNDVAAAQTRFNSAQIEFSRADRLLAENAIARSVFEQREAEMEVARTQLETANRALEDSVLVSPFAGVIADTAVDEFQNVSAGTTIATLQTTGESQAAVQVPATLVANSGSFEPLETYVSLDVSPGTRIPAAIGTKTPTSDPQTQTFLVKFDFDPPADLIILPGMTGMVHVRFAVADSSGTTDRIAIPLNAIIAEGDDRFVWVVDPESMKVSRRTVEIALGIGDTIEIASGLAPGDTIVGAGASYLHEGMQIRPYQP